MNTLKPESELVYKRRYSADKPKPAKVKLQQVHGRIKQSCFSTTCKSYPHYGGRGITVCPEWSGNSAAFVEWAFANGYEEGLSIDRIDNDGNYEPSNCRFVTAKTNTRNRRTSLRMEYNEQLLSLVEILEQAFGSYTNAVYSRVYDRLAAGHDLQHALFAPVQTQFARN